MGIMSGSGVSENPDFPQLQAVPVRTILKGRLTVCLFSASFMMGRDRDDKDGGNTPGEDGPAGI